MKSFASRIRQAKRILVSNPGGIGDDIHLLPALSVLRANSPQAVFDLAASDGAETLLSQVDRVDKVFAVKWSPRFADRVAKRRARMRAMRRAWTQRYDAWIDFRPSDATQLLGVVAHAPLRLGVKCMYWDWQRPWLYSDRVSLTWINQPSYRFLLDSLADAGFDIQGAYLGPHLLPTSIRPFMAYQGGIHVSLCTSADSRELPVPVSRSLIEGLCRTFPDRKVVVTCMSSPRELAMLKQCVQGLDFRNLEVAGGQFSAIELLQVIHACSLHIGPDTGTVHMAWLCGTPSVSWYLNHESLTAWMPEGPRHTVLVSALEQSRKAPCLRVVSSDMILTAARQSIDTNAAERSVTGNADIRFILPGSPATMMAGA